MTRTPAPWKRRTGLLLALPAATAIVLLGVHANISATPPPLEPLLEELRTCYHNLPRGDMPETDENRQAMTFCATGIVVRTLREQGPEVSVTVMRELMRLEPRFDDCHVVAHEIAHEIAYMGDEQRLMDFGLLGECEWGYYDGAVMALSEMYAQETDAELATRAMRFCELYPEDAELRSEVIANCYHGMGHSYWERSYPDSKAAFASCGLITAPPEAPGLASGSVQCAAGVAMSVAESMNAGIPVEPDLEHPSMICPEIREEMHLQCLQYTAYDDIVHRGGDPEGFLDWCESEERLSAEASGGCLIYVATYIGRSGLLEHVELCFERGGDLRGNCLAATLQNFTGFRGEEAGRALCADMPRVCEESDWLPWS